MATYFESFFDSGFAVGVLHYVDAYPGQENISRIVIAAKVEDSFFAQFVVDTGAPWCILDPELAQGVLGSASLPYQPQEKMTIRGTSYEGCLHRVRLSLIPEEGHALEIEATAFVPLLDPGQTWSHPNFIGLDGFLDRIHFAVDPAENAFYFGTLNSV